MISFFDMVSNDDILKILERHKNVFPADQVRLIKENVGLLSDKTKQKIVNAARHAEGVIAVVEKFESEVHRLKKEDEAAIAEFKAKTKSFEKGEREREGERAETMLRNL
ncbi:hypothetical protein JW752_03735 [Candidatus Peregrinibacteria bacterium]|nr:hypothetical protein [Candidatus Peregrinibacteria bacterium]